MTISYNWLSEYLPVKIEPQRLSQILTSIGLEVEKMESFEEIKGNLQGLVIGEVLEAEQHPNADKLKLTKVNIGTGETLQIVCGAPNVSAGQKVVVATVGTTIYPISGEPLTMKVAKIRGVESRGMICAEDEIGVGESHAGIMVLPADVIVGAPAADYFKPYSDIIFEIGLTPNRMDAMSHLGVARDVCAYLTHHDGTPVKPVNPTVNFSIDNQSLPIEVVVEDTVACNRYSGVSIADITVQESPKWLQEKLKAIGLRPINNIVDITNYIQHETGQPLHAFDYDKITGKKIIVKKEAEGTTFITLDEKERKLSSEDLMICNAEKGMCIAGVFGGLESGVTENTKNIFLESAYFDPGTVRKTSFRHGLRTDAATRFEKGIDISGTVNVLKRAAALIKEVAGGEIASDVIDVYPNPQAKEEVTVKYSYLRKLSGKIYSQDSIKNILESLHFNFVSNSEESFTVQVPYHKPDISLPADIVEEILRIDGLDNIHIPTAITITPSVEKAYKQDALKEKIVQFLIGAGFSEILTNSITNSKYINEEEAAKTVRLINNLSSELDVMRPAMLYTALEVIEFNANRKNNNLKLFEFGKTYSVESEGAYSEKNHLCIYLTGQLIENSWKEKAQNADVFYLKGIISSLLQLLGITNFPTQNIEDVSFGSALGITIKNETAIKFGQVSSKLTSGFNIKQPVFFADIDWDILLKVASKTKVQYKGLSKYPSVERDLALVIGKELKYEDIQTQLNKLRLNKLKDVRLFDVFESEKLGKDKKSLAINFTFLDEEKTLTDKEIDGWMNKIMITLEKELSAEIRR